MNVESIHPPVVQDFPFRGLAPFLRLSIAGIDLRPIGQAMLQRAESEPDHAALWMALANTMMAMGLHDAGLSIQAQALALQRVYPIPAKQQPARLRVLMMMAPGDLAANTPLECLLEDTDIDLVFYYLSHHTLFAADIPAHDVLLVAVSEADEHRDLLVGLTAALVDWPVPVVNLPQHIPNTGRAAASRLLQDVPGLMIPPTWRATREQLTTIATEQRAIPALFDGTDFPIILRPVGSHGGHDLERLDNAAALADYLARIAGDAFFISRFVDYRGTDGLFRKCRIALIDGVPFACHMAASTHWMIHYVNAGMYDDASKRVAEGEFMATFAAFADRHYVALSAIAERSALDYVCIDCAETQDGQLLIFEIDHAMIVHAMDLEHLFPYKQIHMAKVRDAFRQMLLRRAGMAPDAE